MEGRTHFEENIVVKVEPEMIITEPQIILNGRFNCDQCIYTANCTRDIKRHKETVHFEIPSGDVEKKIAEALARGIDASLAEDGRLYYHCGRCDYKSVRRDTLKGHIDRKHLGIRNYSPTKPHHKKDKKCDFCEYGTETMKQLSRHKQRVHGLPPSQEEIEASIKEATQHGFTAHSSQESGISFQCNLCQHRATLLSTIKQHRDRKHYGIVKAKRKKAKVDSNEDIEVNEEVGESGFCFQQEILA